VSLTLSNCSKSAADRDLLICIAWQLGVAANQQLDEKSGITYLAGGRRVSVIEGKLNKNKKLARIVTEDQNLPKFSV
jgi:hypothetical protein